MKKDEKIQKELNEARFLSQQGRWAESRLKYETIIAKLRKKPKPGQRIKKRA